jgi:hypothetical protein
MLDGPNPNVSGSEDRFAPHGFISYSFEGPVLREEVRLAERS